MVPYFPELKTSKTSRVFTKHYVNLAVYCRPSEFSLLTWLVYQSGADNTFRNFPLLLAKYRATVFELTKLYKGNKKVNSSIPAIKNDLARLVENGYILPTIKKDVLMVNPMLSRTSNLSKKDYDATQQAYQRISSRESLIDFTSMYINFFKNE